MLNTEKNMLHIIMQIFQREPVDLPSEANLTELYEELYMQSLVPLTYPYLKSFLPKESEIGAKWLERFAQQSYRWFSMMEAQKELTELLTKCGYAHAILKGSANGIYYPHPQLRYSSDIDFLVRVEEIDEIYDMLLGNGFEPHGEKDDSKHHLELQKRNVIFEMHKRPGGSRVEDKQTDQELFAFFQNGLNDVEFVTCGKYSIPILPRLQNAMVLLMHTAQHLQSGLGIRHILDWMTFAKDNVDDDFWYNELAPMAQKGNVYPLAKIMTKMCQKYLGLSKELTWCQDADDELCDMLMEYVFQQGDFGTKAGEKDAEVRVLTDVQKSGGFIKRFKDSSLYSMPAARKYKILLPVAWIYQLFRYATSWIMREHPLRTFRQNRKTAKKRAKFFKELGINRD